MGNSASIAHMSRKGSSTKTRRKNASSKGKKSSSSSSQSQSSSSRAKKHHSSSKSKTKSSSPPTELCGSTADVSDIHSAMTDAYSQSAAETADSSSSNTENSSDDGNNSRSSSSPYRRYKQNEPIPADARSEIRLVRQFLYDKDARNFEGMEAVTDKSCTFFFIDSNTDMLPAHFYSSFKAIFPSFPNLHFFWRYMKISGVDAETGCTIVKVKDYYGEGRHTGVPYCFEPFPEIPTSNINVRDENIELQFFVKDNKIMQMNIDADGKIVGMPGFYTKIGGVIPGL